jgi:hypothetical protein
MVSTTNTKEACDSGPGDENQENKYRETALEGRAETVRFRSICRTRPTSSSVFRRTTLLREPSSLSHNNATLSSDLSHSFLLGSVLPG